MIYKQVLPREVVESIIRKLIRLNKITNEIITIEENTALVIETDESLLNVLLIAVIENAVVHKQYGNLQHRVSITLSAVNDIYCISVKDNGIGIGDHELNKVFELFYKGENSKDSNGLGLFLAKSAVVKLNGSINIFSKPNDGTEVLIMLPIKNVS